MKLCHGTSSRALDRILREGLKPRGRRGGNWKEYPSHPSMVYLTDAFAPYFAGAATRGKDQPLILETELERLDETCLFPDEDLIGQALARNEKWPLPKAQRYAIRHLERWQDKWELGMKHMGTVGHLGTIPPSAFTRYALLDTKVRPQLGMLMDPSGVSPIIYQHMGEQYRATQRWLFDGGELPQLALYRQMRDANMPHADRLVEEWERHSADRTGIIIVELARPGMSVAL